ncbi:aminomethyltransferase [Desulfocicer vacuolatum DSM 3385]|uniref:Aminomethyltransferase n=1 Tax=Desulfocicer vacuolatum DSM 3385 TaxID=1121400 RepID=A0A1W1Z7I9_9BACT|nr:aminomethyltransferase family protein [Desulfocicer vacuolatum]SMC44272.1 aminomethyltransferase [Desulfocicer vacuolatum DSM 3385]
METTIKTTPLNQWHRSRGANMANFGGFDMPLWYDTGVKAEHLAVIQSAGIFDTSHMASVLVNGPGALPLLQYCHTRDLSPLANGRCVYGAILDEKGHVIDDAIVYRFQADQYMVCVNAGMGTAVAQHLKSQLAVIQKTDDTHGTVDIRDLSEKLGKVDIQGKNAAKILQPLLDNPKAIFEKMPYFSFKGHFDDNNPLADGVRLKDGTPILLSRSGYTGEFGFEIFIKTDAVVALWESILTAGEPFDVVACGLGARDSLRAGAVLPLSHQDVGPWKFINHPWMFALPLAPDNGSFTKPFLGDKALLDPKDTFYTLPFAGENLRKVGSGPDSQVLDKNGEVLGIVLTCATDMAIGRHDGTILSIASPDLPRGFKARGISCGFIRVDRPLEVGTPLVLREKKRKINVTVVSDVRPHRTARRKITDFLDTKI